MCYLVMLNKSVRLNVSIVLLGLLTGPVPGDRFPWVRGAFIMGT